MDSAYKSPLENRRALGLNALGFVLVTLAAYLSAVVVLGYVLNTISWPKAATLISLDIIYLVNGVYGYAWARNWARKREKHLSRTRS